VATPLVKCAVNGLLARLGAAGERLPGEVALATELGISRTPLRGALRILARRGVLRRTEGGHEVARAPRRADGFPEAAEPASKADAFASFFMRKLARGELKPGARISELELARAAGVTTVTAREGLLRLARFGILAKEPRRRWRMAELDERAIDELFDVRELLELSALEHALRLPDGHRLRHELQSLREEHRRFARSARKPIDRFLALDERLHGALFAAAGNRYLDQMFAAVAMTIRFQLRHGPVGEYGMGHGLAQHPAIIDALLLRDAPAARRALRAHLASARTVMKLAARPAEAGAS
jgi:DNA-binding GntR family transcriptional regulator